MCGVERIHFTPWGTHILPFTEDTLLSLSSGPASVVAKLVTKHKAWVRFWIQWSH